MSLFQDNSKEFHIDNEEIQEINNNPYYVLPKNTKIYFGSKSKVFDDKPTFFGFDKETAEKYGFVKTFKTNKELHLLALMELTPKHSFYKNADKKWKKKMEIIFGVGQETKERFSVGTSDIEMMDYLCKKNMDGYAMNGKYRGDKDFGDFFHAELVLCKPIEDADLIAEDYTVKSITPPRIPKKRGKSRLQEEKSEEGEGIPFSLDNFDNSSYDSPPVTPKKNSYDLYDTSGGKRKNKKTKRKLRKSKKSKRKQRTTRKK